MKLAAKVSIIASTAVIGALLVSATLVYYLVQKAVSDTIYTAQTQTAEQTVDKLDRFLNERMVNLQFIGSMDQLGRAIVSPTPQNMKEATTDLIRLKSYHTAWEDMAVVDLTGKPVAMTLNGAAAQQYFDALQQLGPLFAQAVQESRVVSSDVFLDVRTGRPALAYFAPVYSPDNANTVVGMVGGQLSWNAVESILKGVTNSDALLVDSKGNQIASNHEDASGKFEDISQTALYKGIAAAGAGERGTLSLEDPIDGEEELVSYAREKGYMNFKGNGWRVAILTPVETALAPAQRTAIILGGSLAAVALIALTVLLIFMNRNIMRPIRQLSDAVEGISSGNWGAKVKINSHDEIGHLADVFNTMTGQLSIASEQLQQEKARLESSINSLPLGFILTDARNGVLSFNPVMRQMLGIKHADDLSDKSGKTIAMLETILAKCREVLDSGKPQTSGYAAKNGRYLQMFFSPVVENHRIIGVVALVEDITEAKLLERSKDEFLSIASHELRTPLTAIRGNSSMVKDFYKEQVHDEDFDQIVDDIHDSSIRLIEIVNDFLDASRLEQGKMEFRKEEFDISRVIESVSYELTAVMKEKKLYFKVDKTLHTLPHVYADKNRVKQVIYNLAGNALKFTERGGITVGAEVLGNKVHVTVIDTGRGISDKNQNLLFHKFQQAGNSLYTRDTTRGTGLGLYISKLLVENMGGTLALEHSEEGKGTTFGFTIPIVNAEQHEDVKD